MSKKEKIVFGTTSVLAISLGVTTAIGTSFCALASILFVPAFVPIMIFAVYKLVKINLNKKQTQKIV